MQQWKTFVHVFFLYRVIVCILLANFVNLTWYSLNYQSCSILSESIKTDICQSHVLIILNKTPCILFAQSKNLFCLISNRCAFYLGYIGYNCIIMALIKWIFLKTVNFFLRYFEKKNIFLPFPRSPYTPKLVHFFFVYIFDTFFFLTSASKYTNILRLKQL